MFGAGPQRRGSTGDLSSRAQFSPAVTSPYNYNLLLLLLVYNLLLSLLHTICCCFSIQLQSAAVAAASPYNLLLHLVYNLLLLLLSLLHTIFCCFCSIQSAPAIL